MNNSKPEKSARVLNAMYVECLDLDTPDYKNELEVGEALKEAIDLDLVKREDLFITTKARINLVRDCLKTKYERKNRTILFHNNVQNFGNKRPGKRKSCRQCPSDKKTWTLWNSDHGHVIEACKNSLKKLQLDYLDLFFIHFPIASKHSEVGTTRSLLDEEGVLEIDTTISLETTWHDMEKLVDMGLVRSIGVSNYDLYLTRDCLAYANVKPAKHGIAITAHTPLGGALANTERFGTVSCLDDPVLKKLSDKHNKLEENIDIFDFELSKEDMELVRCMERKYRTNSPAKAWGIDVYA
ncbi:hypothetical protein POM88_053552 [Heracleum sosnowskyi]|uniref:NADP-dependent oxidoreductase domain-containing protein n=1 Tax=Heracleum sosnowskyi TaxID=360622 RepID=A0AAD8GQJ3_9APIA|nr:hypothetical protein POM88_053552 [Heracleum sosnowskyi]